MKPKTQRLWGVILGLGCLGGAVTLALFALQENLLFFYTPSDLQTKVFHQNQRIRLGGIVEKNSLQHFSHNQVKFILTDLKQQIAVVYQGILPDLFREGQGVVVEGYLKDKTSFEALSVLAKHDENYMPPQVAKALERKKSQ